MNHINENRIREFAYQIWESEGKPDGQAQRHWEMAYKLAQSQTGEGQLAQSLGGKQATSEETGRVAEKTYGNDTFGQPIAAYDKPAEAEMTDQIAKPKKSRSKAKPANAEMMTAAVSETSPQQFAGDATKPEPAKPKKSKVSDKALLSAPQL